ncbi:MAG TPA: LOG family protein, partial [bacterium]|nr:LOG family protein [bacterium]
LTLIQTGKVDPFPIVLIGKTYWSGLLDWMKASMLKERYINPEDLELFHVTDSAKEAVRIIQDFYKKNKKRGKIRII